MSGLPVVVFPVKNLTLTKSEKKVVDKLVEAAKSIAQIYQKQENQKYLGAKVGEIIEVNTPIVRARYKILEIK